MTPPASAESGTTAITTVSERLARGADAAWVLPAHIAVLALAAFVYIFNLTVSGYANTFYSMAAQAASQDWSAWFWGSLDSSNFITVDKPPLATMVTGLSVRIFGLSSWSILLPEALFGVATIAVLYVIVRRTAGPAAATIAALVATLTPAAVLIFRYNNPDALLTLLLVLAAWAFMRALSDGRMRWLIVTGLLIGLAFNTKFLQAYLVLPAFAVVYAWAAPGSVRRRLVGLGVALASVLTFSGWWVLAVQLTPASMRPYIGGSTDGTALQLLFGYDGLGRIFGELTGGAVRNPGSGPGGPGGNFGGAPGLLRLYNRDFGGQVAWLLPFATIGAAASLLLRRHKARTDLPRAAVLMWTLWLLVHVVVFSLMDGIIHSYYVVVMAPAIGALVGIGAVDLWRARKTHRELAGLALASAIGMSAFVAWDLLNRTPDFLPGLSTLVLIIGIGAAAVIAVAAVLPPSGAAAVRRTAGRLTLAAVIVGMGVTLVGPAAYALDSMSKSFAGGDPSAGPSFGRAVFAGFPGVFISGPNPGPGGGRPFRPPVNPAGNPPGGTPNDPTEQSDGSAGGLKQAELAYLVANRGDARWIVAASSSSQAAPIQLVTGQPVMAMGGFNGSDPVPTLDQLKAYISTGELRFVMAAGAGFGGFGQGLGQVTGMRAWVRANCSLVGVAADSANDLYDCAGAV
jgi:4-amino-4-deoxy-L-arabinose transferase-like glycosyltransferase